MNKMNKVDKILKWMYCYFVCLLVVSSCWVGLEYILEGVVHSSQVDGYVSVVLSCFMADKYMDVMDKIKR